MGKKEDKFYEWCRLTGTMASINPIQDSFNAGYQAALEAAKESYLKSFNSNITVFDDYTMFDFLKELE